MTLVSGLVKVSIRIEFLGALPFIKVFIFISAVFWLSPLAKTSKKSPTLSNFEIYNSFGSFHGIITDFFTIAGTSVKNKLL